MDFPAIGTITMDIFPDTTGSTAPGSSTASRWAACTTSRRFGAIAGRWRRWTVWGGGFWVSFHGGHLLINVNPGLINPKRLFNWEGSSFLFYMGMDQYLLIPFLLGWTSMNPSYFDVNYRGIRFWHTANYFSNRKWMNMAINRCLTGNSIFDGDCPLPPLIMRGSSRFFPPRISMLFEFQGWRVDFYDSSWRCFFSAGEGSWIFDDFHESQELVV